MSRTHLIAMSMLLALATAPGASPLVRKDATAGNPMHILTDTSGVNTIGYPTCRTWSSDGKSLFIESSRPRPDGTSHPRERQLLKIDITDGKIAHLATLEAEDTAQYGKAHRSISSHYHADYAPEAEIMVYYDMTGHNMYLLDLKTGRRERILHEAEGTIGDPPSISLDGTRIVYYVIYPAVESKYFTDLNSVIFVLDVDPKTLKPVGEPRVVVAYPGRKGSKYDENKRDQVHVDHCQLNPTNKDHISYAHEFSGCEVDGSLLKCRLWQVMADGTGDRPIVRQQAGGGQTHELFAPNGKKSYWVDWGLIYSADFESGKATLVFDGRSYGACHAAVSPDERWIAADMFGGLGNDEHGNPISGILLIDTKTGEHRVVCKFPRLPSHPGHPHPNFSPDGTKIAFTLADGPNTRVGYIDLTECKQ